MHYWLNFQCLIKWLQMFENVSICQRLKSISIQISLLFFSLFLPLFLSLLLPPLSLSPCLILSLPSLFNPHLKQVTLRRWKMRSPTRMMTWQDVNPRWYTKTECRVTHVPYFKRTASSWDRDVPCSRSCARPERYGCNRIALTCFCLFFFFKIH